MRALEAAGEAGAIDVTWIGRGWARARGGHGCRPGAGRARPRRASTHRHAAIGRPTPPGGAAVRCGTGGPGAQAKLDVGLADDARTEKHAARCSPRGLDWPRARRLARRRRAAPSVTGRVTCTGLHDAMLARGRSPSSPRASTLLRARRSLATVTGCHADLAVDLPAWLVHGRPRRAGSVTRGLTFSYLVLRRDGRRLSDAVPARQDASCLRMVSGPMPEHGQARGVSVRRAPVRHGPASFRGRG